MIRTEPLEVVSIADAALDVEQMAGSVGNYAITRDVSLVREVPGQKVTRFYIEDIPSSLMWSYVLEPPNGSPLRAYRAFQYGVRRVVNFKRKDGTVAEFVSPHGTGSVVPFWTEQQMAEFPPVYVAEIGDLAFSRSFFGDTRPQAYPLSDTSHAALAHRMYLLADKIREDVAALNAKPSEAEAPTSA